MYPSVILTNFERIVAQGLTSYLCLHARIDSLLQGGHAHEQKELSPMGVGGVGGGDSHH